MAVAKYTEIYITLRARIEGGRYAFRQFLPSEKALTAGFKSVTFIGQFE